MPGFIREKACLEGQNSAAGTDIGDKADLIHRQLEELRQDLARQESAVIGYPGNKAFDYSFLQPFLAFTLNNLGDPCQGSHYPLNTLRQEQDVVRYFADLLHLAQDDAWGYVTSGGTAGNLHGLLLGRERFPDGYFYYSSESHYGIGNILKILDRTGQGIKVQTLDNGEIDYAALERQLARNRHIPAIFLLNIGTTMKGAIDDVAKIQEIIHRHGIKKHFIHCDCALSGMILPFVDDAPPFDFRAGIDSLCVSGHKFLGSPLPNGVFLCKQSHARLLARSAEYVGDSDNTLMGSRCAFSPLVLWYAVHAHPPGFFRRMVAESLATADWAIELLQGRGIDAWRNRHSITVVFPKPHEAVLRKWKLATHGDIAHLVCYPGIRPVLAEFVSDYAKACEGLGR